MCWGRGASPDRYALIGANVGIPGFVAIIVSSQRAGIPLFLLGTLATGIGAGLFGHATLTAAIRNAPRDRIGLAVGAWGALQATAAGICVANTGVVRDAIVGWQGAAGIAAQSIWSVVFMTKFIF